MTAGFAEGPSLLPPLPSDWKWARLGDLGKAQDAFADGPFGSSLKTEHYTNSGARVIRLQNIGFGKFLGSDRAFVSLEHFAALKRHSGADCFRVRLPTEMIDPEYLVLFLNSPLALSLAADRIRGATRPRLNLELLKETPIPFAPLKQQKSVVAHLRAQLAAVDGARAAAEVRLEAARALPASILTRAFRDRRMSGWPGVRLGTLLALRREIVHPSDRANGVAVFVGLEHIESGTGRRIGELQLALGELTGRKPIFRKGDLVYGYLRPYLNKVWIAEFDGVCSVDQYSFTVDPTRAESRFVAWFMRSPLYLQRAKVESGPGQLPRIRMEEVANVETPLPPLSQQGAVVESIESQLGVAQTAVTAAEAELAAINALPAALLRRAFSGEL